MIHRGRGERTGGARLLTILLLATVGAAVLRFALAVRLPVLDDEAYYWLWSLHPAWSYPDHPPMIAALIAAGTAAFGGSPIAIRLLPALLASATPLLGYILGRDLFDRGTGLRAALLLMTLPIFALGTAFAFPDGPMAFFWLLGAWAGWRALQRGGWWWGAAGTAAGLSFLAKATALFLVLGLALAWAVDPERRPLARDLGWFAGLLLGAAFAAPVLVWNAQHDWMMVEIALRREPWITPRTIPANLLAFAGGVVLFHGLLALPLAGTLLIAVRRWQQPAWRYLAVMALPLCIPVIVGALDAVAKPHWPSPALAFGTVGLAALWPHWSRRRPLLLGSTTAATVLLTIGLAGALFVRAGAGIADRWETVTPVIVEEARAQRAPVVTSSYQSASQILYQVQTRLPVTTNYGAFRQWYQPEEWVGRDVLYIDDRDPTNPFALRRAQPPTCRDLRFLRRLDLSPRRVLDLYACRSLSGL